MAAQQKLPSPKIFRPPQKGQLIQSARCHYYLGARFARGGFAHIYNCRDEWGNELVAKVILPRSEPYEQVKERWLHELEALVNLRHPNITFVYDAFEFCDTFYLIIEKCQASLADLFKMRGLAGEIWLPHVAKDILQALEYIHGVGDVHKDLHPANVFVREVRDTMLPEMDPVLVFKVGDLGISRLEEEIRGVGTVLANWMLPPEYLDAGEFGQVGKQVDIYHVGLILLGLLLNRMPQFTREEILAGEPRRLAESTLSPYAPAIAKALRRHVAERTRTPIEFWRQIAEAPVPSPQLKLPLGDENL